MVEYQEDGQGKVYDGQQEVAVEDELLPSEFGQDGHCEYVADKLHPCDDNTGVHADRGQDLADDGVGLGDDSSYSCHLHHEGELVSQQNGLFAVLNLVFLVDLSLCLLLHPLALGCYFHQFLVVYVLDVVWDDEQCDDLSGLVVFVLPD